MNHLVPLSLLGLALSGVADASTFRQISFGELMESSVAVAQVKVVSTQSGWTMGERPDIRTWATVEVLRSLDGDLQTGDTLTIQELGGSVGGETAQAIGFPTFAHGDQLVVFLTHWPGTDDWRVAEYGQGIYQVIRDAQGQDRVIPGLVQGGGPRSVLSPAETVVAPHTRVDELIQSIRAARR